MTRLPSIATLNRDLLQTWVDTLDEQTDGTEEEPIRKRRSTKNKNAGTDEQRLLKKDVYWQTSKPVSFDNMDITSILYSETFGERDDFVKDLLTDDFNFCPVKQEITTSSGCLDQTFPLHEQQHEQRQLSSQSMFSRGSTSSTSSAFDTYSSTSDDSIGSFESVEEAYKMPPTPLQWVTPPSSTEKSQQQHCEKSSRDDNVEPRTIVKAKRKQSANTKNKSPRKHKIDPVYNSDPYLQRHRLMVNARQKNRMMKINNMYSMLNGLLPDHVLCEQNVKPHSKLGILKRAIAYWKSLSDVLLTPLPNDENTNENSLTSAGCLLYTSPSPRDS